MNWFERWIIERVLYRIVVQGPNHQQNVTGFYKLVADAARNEFTEDNKPTLDHFLTECHKDSLDGF